MSMPDRVRSAPTLACAGRVPAKWFAAGWDGSRRLRRLVAAAVACVLAPGGLAEGSHSPARRVAEAGPAVVDADVARFWRAFDAIRATPSRTERLRLIRTMYIDPGTPGLHALMSARRYTAEQYVDAIADWPRFWASVRPLTLRSHQAAGALAGDVRRFRSLYPELQPATITYAIGVLRTGGTTVGDKVLIGAELALGDERVDVSELPEPLRSRLGTFFGSRPFANNAQNNIHEYVHTQQRETRGSLLQQTVREGVADFVAELITGRRPALPVYTYGPAHDEAVRTAFRGAMDGDDYSEWLWNGTANRFGVSDLGYYVGYRIARAYHARAADKRVAIRDLIQLAYDDPVAVRKLVSASGYMSPSATAPQDKFQAVTSRTIAHRVVDEVLSPWSAGGMPGCAVGVSIDGRMDYERGVGAADLANGAPITPRTVFHAASIAKQFTAFSIGLLEQRGHLSYADPVRKFIPELPMAMDAITIDHLIHHTDGIREQGQLLHLSGWRVDDVVTEEDVMWALTRQRRLNFEPGTEVVYGNAAYTLLAVIVQRVSGRTLREFAATEIFRPLGMASTRFADGYSEVVRDRALSYIPGQGGAWAYAPLSIRHSGSTGLLTTVGDLLKWERNLLDGRVGGSRLAGTMRRSGTLRDGTRIDYGHGLRLRGYRGLPMVSHDGSDAGFRSEALLFPDQRLAVVTLCNGSNADAGRIARRIADGYLVGRTLRPELEPITPMALQEQAAFAGTYWSAQTDEIIDLRWNGSALRAAGSTVDLVPIGHRSFRPADQPHEWRFDRTADGARTLSIRDSWPTRRSFARLETPLPAADVLVAAAGRYRSPETETTYVVRIVDGRLRLSWPRGNDLPLTPVAANLFSSGIGTVTFLPDGNGHFSGLTVSNRRLRRLGADRVR